MPTAQKAQIIEATKERYSRAAGVFFTEYRGLKVRELQQLRQSLSKAGGEIQVVKNTLFRIAAGDDAEKLPIELTSGPNAVTFVYENEVDVAKALVDFGKKNKRLVIKGGYLAGRTYSDKDVETLAKLPPREVLIAQVIGAIAAPLTSLVGVIEALYADPIRTIGAVADKVAEGAPESADAASSEESNPSATEEAAPSTTTESETPQE